MPAPAENATDILLSAPTLAMEAEKYRVKRFSPKESVIPTKRRKQASDQLQTCSTEDVSIIQNHEKETKSQPLPIALLSHLTISDTGSRSPRTKRHKEDSKDNGANYPVSRRIFPLVTSPVSHSSIMDSSTTKDNSSPTETGLSTPPPHSKCTQRQHPVERQNDKPKLMTSAEKNSPVELSGDVLKNTGESKISGSESSRLCLSTMMNETNYILQPRRYSQSVSENQDGRSSAQQRSTASLLCSPSPPSVVNEIFRLVNILSALRDRYSVCFPSVCYRWHWLRVVTASTMQDLGAYQVILSLSDSEIHSIKHKPRASQLDESFLATNITSDSSFRYNPSVKELDSPVQESTSLVVSNSSEHLTKDDGLSVEVGSYDIPLAIDQDVPLVQEGTSDAELLNHPKQSVQCELSTVQKHISDTEKKETDSAQHQQELGNSSACGNEVLSLNDDISKSEKNSLFTPPFKSMPERLTEALLSPPVVGRVLGDLHFLFYSLSRGSARVSFLRAHSQATEAAAILQRTFGNDRTLHHDFGGEREKNFDKIREAKTSSTPDSQSPIPSNLDVVDPTTLSLYNIAIGAAHQIDQYCLPSKLASASRVSSCYGQAHIGRTSSDNSTGTVRTTCNNSVMGRDAAEGTCNRDNYLCDVITSSCKGTSLSPAAGIDHRFNSDDNNNHHIQHYPIDNRLESDESVNLIHRAVNMGYWRLDPHPILPSIVHPDILAEAFRNVASEQGRRSPGRTTRKSKGETASVQDVYQNSKARQTKAERKKPGPKPQHNNKPGAKLKARGTGLNETQIRVEKEEDKKDYIPWDSPNASTNQKLAESNRFSQVTHDLSSKPIPEPRLTRKRANQTETTALSVYLDKTKAADGQFESNGDVTTSLYEQLDVGPRAASLRSHRRKVEEFLELKTDGKPGVQTDLLVDVFPLPKRRATRPKTTQEYNTNPNLANIQNLSQISMKSENSIPTSTQDLSDESSPVTMRLTEEVDMNVSQGFVSQEQHVAEASINSLATVEPELNSSSASSPEISPEDASDSQSVENRINQKQLESNPVAAQSSMSSSHADVQLLGKDRHVSGQTSAGIVPLASDHEASTSHSTDCYSCKHVKTDQDQEQSTSGHESKEDGRNDGFENLVFSPASSNSTRGSPSERNRISAVVETRSTFEIVYRV